MSLWRTTSALLMCRTGCSIKLNNAAMHCYYSTAQIFLHMSEAHFTLLACHPSYMLLCLATLLVSPMHDI